MNTNSEILQKERRKQSILMYLGIALLVLAVALVSTAAIQVFGGKKNAEHLNDVIVREGEDKTGLPAYADFDGYFQFASYGDELGYYIAYDQDYFYIMSIPEKDYDYFEKQFDGSDNSVRFWGYTEKVPSEAKSYAIESLNEEMEEKFVDFDNFDDVFGDVMLAADKESNVFGIKSMFNRKGHLTVPGLLCALFGVILFLTGRNGVKNYDRLFDSSDLNGQRILSEVNSGSAKWFEDLRVFLTDHYIVSARGGVAAVAFSEIFWAYVTRHRTNGIQDYNFLTLCTKDGRRINCGNGRTAGKKHRARTEEEHTALLETIAQKNPEVLIGFTKAISDAFTALCKQLKQK